MLDWTLDKVLVEQHYLRALARHLRSFEEEYPTPRSTLATVAAVLERMADDKTVRAAAFNHNSRARPFWFVPAQIADDAGGIIHFRRPYNTRRDNRGHWYLVLFALDEPEASEHPGRTCGPVACGRGGGRADDDDDGSGSTSSQLSSRATSHG